MILLVDSGATNSSWKFMTSDDDQIIEKRKGVNLATSDIRKLSLDFPKELCSKVEKIFFFGAGAGHKSKDEEMKAQLLHYFVNATKIVVGSDLVTAGLVLSEGERCVISILGTGSNCCIFDGKNIAVQVNSLGYVLGDEGSGFSMGRTILRKYFYNQMRKKDAELFESTYHLSRNDLIQRVYHTHEGPNTYIASFCTFLSTCSLELRREVACDNLQAFFDQQLQQLDEGSNYKYHFSGSIAWHFQSEIKEICLNYGYKVGGIIQNPIDSLSYSKLIEL